MPETNKQMIVIYKENFFTLDTEMTSSKSYFYDEGLIRDFKENHAMALYRFGFRNSLKEMAPSLAFLHKVAATFVKSLASDPDIEVTRIPQPVSFETSGMLLDCVPYVIGGEFITYGWINEIWNMLSDVFEEEIGKSNESVSDYLRAQDPDLNVAGKVFFHLVENQSDENHPFAFLATYSTSGKEGRKAVHTPLKNALLEYKNKDELLLKLLAAVSRAADKSGFISELVESGELFSPLRFTVQESYTFLKEIPLYEECGILCRVPDWWRKKYNNARLSVTVGDKAPSTVGIDALVQFDPELYFGDIKMSRDEMARLMNEAEGLTMIKGKWVEIDHEKLKRLLEAYEMATDLAADGELTMAEAMRAQLTVQQALHLPQQEDMLEVSNGRWLQEVKNRLLHPEEIEELSLGEEFKADLRGYQQAGLDWLGFMNQLSFGALLADDMGLGKTVQILALLEHLREQKKTRSLLVIPASLIGNWQQEIEKFAPQLQYKLLHTGLGEEFDPENQEDTDLYITTYGMVVRLEKLMEFKWDLLILDEAQAIKNPGTKQTKSIKQLQAAARIAMTGTPIENKLGDLWSIFDFLNRGFLGTAKEFTGMVKDLEDYSRLRKAVSPFILRRLKTDKSIISDLPDKVEVNAYTTLTKKQVVLYKKFVNELEQSLKEAEGIGRKGLVLASIMKFKQICNHPDQYLGKGEFDYSHSGKFEKLKEICETIYEKRERVLVFTQFKEMTEPLADYLETIFKRKGLILHGGTPVKRRGELVEQFCGEEYIPFMVLSLKAGGVGLNLTSANHVIHFDRWWNPAVENQATDRAFRIGQKKNVMVHKFITRGTIEEKIDAMIGEKQKLSDDIIAQSGESWITELGNEELMSMFQLF